MWYKTKPSQIKPNLYPFIMITALEFKKGRSHHLANSCCLLERLRWRLTKVLTVFALNFWFGFKVVNLFFIQSYVSGMIRFCTKVNQKDPGNVLVYWRQHSWDPSCKHFFYHKIPVNNVWTKSELMSLDFAMSEIERYQSFKTSTWVASICSSVLGAFGSRWLFCALLESCRLFVHNCIGNGVLG